MIYNFNSVSLILYYLYLLYMIFFLPFLYELSLFITLLVRCIDHELYDYWKSSMRGFQIGIEYKWYRGFTYRQLTHPNTLNGCSKINVAKPYHAMDLFHFLSNTTRLALWVNKNDNLQLAISTLPKIFIPSSM